LASNSENEGWDLDTGALSLSSTSTVFVSVAFCFAVCPSVSIRGRMPKLSMVGLNKHTPVERGFKSDDDPGSNWYESHGSAVTLVKPTEEKKLVVAELTLRSGR
jgi:hypothetical protein